MLDHSVFDRQYRAWLRFCQAGEIDTACVRPEVARSWLRCRDAGLDPRGPKVPVRLQRDELARLLVRNRRYMEAATPIMGFPAQAVRDTAFRC